MNIKIKVKNFIETYNLCLARAYIAYEKWTISKSDDDYHCFSGHIASAKCMKDIVKIFSEFTA